MFSIDITNYNDRCVFVGYKAIINLEKRITSELKILKDKGIIDKSNNKNIKPVGSRPGIL